MTTNNKNLPAETQFFAIETKGRTGIREMVSHYQDSMWSCKPSYMMSAQKKAYFEKAIMHISNQDSLKPLMATREGLFQIYLSLCKAVRFPTRSQGNRRTAARSRGSGQWTPHTMPPAEGHPGLSSGRAWAHR